MFAITVFGVICVILSSNIRISSQCESCAPDYHRSVREVPKSGKAADVTPNSVSPDSPDPLDDHLTEEKAAHKSGEIYDLGVPVTMKKIKAKLKELGVFDSEDKSLSEREKKELNKLYAAVEIMTTSRARQPSSVQNVYSALRVVERAVKKQLKEGQISDTLASKFDWDKISQRPKRERPPYYYDRATNMRVFDTE